MVYSPYIIICWFGFEVFIRSVAWSWQHRSCFFDADAGVTLGNGSFKIFAWLNHERSYR
jgi:hypothetical protein